MADLARGDRNVAWPERWLTLRQQLAAGLALALATTALCWAALAWLDARTPDPPGFDGTMILLGALALVPGVIVGWAVLGRIERRVADLAVYAAALARARPATPRPAVAGSLGEVAAGLNGVADRLAAQAERLRELAEQRAGLTAPLREAAAQEERNRLARELPDAAIVVLTSAADDARVIAARRAGALGYILKEAEPELLLAAVRSAAHGRAVLDPAVTTTVLHGLHAPQGGRGAALTPREREVLRLLTRGLVNKQIADDLSIGEETVKTHVGNILAKLGVAHRTEAAIVALREGLAGEWASSDRRRADAYARPQIPLAHSPTRPTGD